MLTFVAALGLSISILATVTCFQLADRRRRKLRLQNLELRPNCLLTRHPILFISGPRSVFRLFCHWQDISTYLREHGYETMVAETTRKDPVNSLLNAFAEVEERFHLIADSSLESEMREIVRRNPENIVSFTLVQTADSAAKKTRPAREDLQPLPRAIETLVIENSQAEIPRLARVIDRVHGALHGVSLNAHDILAHEARFLDHAITLAENDVRSDARWGVQ